MAPFRGAWQLYDLKNDRSETKDPAAERPETVTELAAAWQAWADKVGAIPWEKLPGANYKPTAGYRKKSEPVPDR